MIWKSGLKILYTTFLKGQVCKHRPKSINITFELTFHFVIKFKPLSKTGLLYFYLSRNASDPANCVFSTIKPYRWEYLRSQKILWFYFCKTKIRFFYQNQNLDQSEHRTQNENNATNGRGQNACFEVTPDQNWAFCIYRELSKTENVSVLNIWILYPTLKLIWIKISQKCIRFLFSPFIPGPQSNFKTELIYSVILQLLFKRQKSRLIPK